MTILQIFLLQKTKKIVHLEDNCYESDHASVKKLLETSDKKLNIIWELKNSFDRKCNECCLMLIQKCTFEKIVTLKFDQKRQWKSLAWNFLTKSNTLMEVPIIYLAVQTGLLSVVEYILEQNSKEIYRELD